MRVRPASTAHSSGHMTRDRVRENVTTQRRAEAKAAIAPDQNSAATNQTALSKPTAGKPHRLIEYASTAEQRAISEQIQAMRFICRLTIFRQHGLTAPRCIKA